MASYMLLRVQSNKGSRLRILKAVLEPIAFYGIELVVGGSEEARAQKAEKKIHGGSLLCPKRGHSIARGKRRQEMVNRLNDQPKERIRSRELL